MNFIYEYEDQTYNLTENNEKRVVDSIVKKYDSLYDAREKQINETNALRDEIYQRTTYIEDKKTGYKSFCIPELSELSQSFMAHAYENIYKSPETMFDCQGEDEQSEQNASTQKAMLVYALEKMHSRPEMEKMIKSVVESGEAVFFVGWEKRVKKVRRKKTAIEKIQDNILSGFKAIFGNEKADYQLQLLKDSTKNYVEYEKPVYEGVVIKCLDNLEFVFDPFKSDDFENADMMYRSFKTYDELISNKNFNLSSEAKLNLKQIDDEDLTREEHEIKKDGDKDKGKDGQIEIIEYWGDIKIGDKLIKNYLIVIADKKYIIRFEPNPYIHKPFVYGNIIEDPETRRGVSLLRVAKSLNDISSEILSKQVYCLDLTIHPVWLSPEKMFDKDQELKPGKVLEYKSDKLNNTNLRPEKLDFSRAFTGFDFISYFKSLIENATGIFKNMVGQNENRDRTATETQAVVAGQSARQNYITDKIYSTLIIPTIEKIADTIANEQFGDVQIYKVDKTTNIGETVQITDETRNGNYRYIYSDNKTASEKLVKFKDSMTMIKEFAQIPDVQKNIDFTELFKMALEKYSFDNPARVILDQGEKIQKNVEDINTQKVIQDYAQQTFNAGNINQNQGIANGGGELGMPNALPEQQITGYGQ